MITYAIEPDLGAGEFVSVLLRSTLGERRPVNDLEKIRAMLRHANLIITARLNGELVGVARSLSDLAFCTYLSDLAVDTRCQKQGIGRELVRLTMLHSGGARLILLSAPAAMDYYPKIGMKAVSGCYSITRIEELSGDRK